MKYKVKLTTYASSQIAETVSYISKVLFAPQTAKNWVDVLQKEIRSLDTLPERFPYADSGKWRSVGIRKMFVNGFLVYYFVDEKSKSVWITAVIYEKRDQLKNLDKMGI